MQLPKDKGGMALPDLKDYYCAAQRRLLGYLCDSQYRVRWKEIERGGSVGPPIQALIAHPKLQENLITKDDPWIKSTLKTWHRVVVLINTCLQEKLESNSIGLP